MSIGDNSNLHVDAFTAAARRGMWYDVIKRQHGRDDGTASTPS